MAGSHRDTLKMVLKNKRIPHKEDLSMKSFMERLVDIQKESAALYQFYDTHTIVKVFAPDGSKHMIVVPMEKKEVDDVMNLHKIDGILERTSPTQCKLEENDRRDAMPSDLKITSLHVQQEMIHIDASF